MEDQSNGGPAVRKLADGQPLEGRAVTLDALHVQCETARSLVEDHNADYDLTAVKGNQPELREDLRAIDWHTPECAALEYAEVDKGHGRIETRRCRAVGLTGEEWNEHCRLPFRQQAVRIERQRHILKSGKITTETAYCITSLSPEQATPQRLLSLVRGHWQIETRLHHVRDVADDEDRCRAHVRNLPRNLACTANAAISIVRRLGQFQYLPQAHRHSASRQQDALSAVLKPLPA